MPLPLGAVLESLVENGVHASRSWSDDQLTLWPGESQTITVRYAHTALRGARPAVTVAGWNVARQQATAR